MLTALFAAGVLAADKVAAETAPKLPNVIFVLADDLGYGDVGWTVQNRRRAKGADCWIETPHMDRMAAEGRRLTAHYAAAPVCAPSRASILTGKHQGRCSLRDNLFDYAILERRTIGTLMREAGYATYAIGKWGVGGGGESGTPASAHPLDRGFDHSYGFLDHLAGHTYYHYEGFFKGAYMGVVEDRERRTGTAEGIYSTDLFIARAKKVIADQVAENRAKGTHKPFFIYLAVNAIHGSNGNFLDKAVPNRVNLHVPGRPYPDASPGDGKPFGLGSGADWDWLQANREDASQRNTWTYPYTAGFDSDAKKRYATGITRLDDGMEDLRQTLVDLGIEKDTLVIFTSDNGPANEYGTNAGYFDSNGGFRGIKRDVLEGGLREPTFLWWPGRIPAGSVDDRPSMGHGWYGFLENLVKTGKAGRLSGEVYTEYTHGVSGNDQVMARIGDYVGVNTAVAAGMTFDTMPISVYDVVKDPGQTKDLAGDPKVAAEIMPRMRELMKSRHRLWRRPDSCAKGGGWRHYDRPYDIGEKFTDEEPIALDLGGTTREVESWRQDKWNGQSLSVTNGTLVFTKSVGIHGGKINVGPRTTLRFARGSSLGTGLGDAGTRVFDIAPGSRLDMDGIRWNMDHTRVVLSKGAEWNADLTRLELAGAMKDNLWDISGRAVFARGINVAKGDWGHALKVVLREGGELLLGGPVSTNGTKKCSLDVVLEGGSATLFWNARIDPGIVRLAPGAKVELRVAQGAEFDESSISVPDGAKLTVKRGVAVPEGLPPRYALEVKYDRTGRSWWICADAYKDEIADWRVRYPNPDAESPVRIETAKPTDTLFRRRFPSGDGPWNVQVAIKNRKGGKDVQTISVARPENAVVQPAPNELVMVGQCGYGEATNLVRDILRDDLCNLYVGWNGAAKTLPRNVPEDMREAWAQAIRDRGMWSMSIYAGDNEKLQKELVDAYDGRYLGNNCGEYASFMYQGRKECGIPMDLDLAAARDRFVNRYCGNAGFGWLSRFPWMFSTCGAALSCYELAGGIDFICNEQWAIGAQNIAHTSAEARGASRKWGPEYWCAWNAHEWQTCGIPYRTDQKYDSCLAGFLQEYVFGTSIIVLESGAQGKQAWEYTADEPGQPKEERAKEGYDGYVAKRYREVTKRFYEWVKANPRDRGTPETKIAMALGNLDAYLGQDGGFTVWSQHDNAAANPALWKYGPPERTQALLEDIFFPRPKDLVEPFRNGWLAGTPYGQADVMQIDDDSTLADLRRYDLLVFGGWNTMTPHVKDVLERYVTAGGTLVMSRPELTTRTDRDFLGYTDKDLLPPFGLLPPEGAPGDFTERAFGKGRYFLFTARTFPAAPDGGGAQYASLVRRLASGVRQTVRISSDEPGAADAITYAVYPDTVYFLNMDTRRARTFKYELGGKTHGLSLPPCGIKTLRRGNQVP